MRKTTAKKLYNIAMHVATKKSVLMCYENENRNKGKNKYSIRYPKMSLRKVYKDIKKMWNGLSELKKIKFLKTYSKNSLCI